MASDPENKGWAEDLVGSEIPLDHLLNASDLRPLLKTMTRAGASLAGIADEKGHFSGQKGVERGSKRSRLPSCAICQKGTMMA